MQRGDDKRHPPMRDAVFALPRIDSGKRHPEPVGSFARPAKCFDHLNGCHHAANLRYAYVWRKSKNDVRYRPPHENASRNGGAFRIWSFFDIKRFSY